MATSTAASSKVKTVLLTQKAEVKETTLTVDTDGNTTMTSIMSALKKKKEPELIGTYKMKQLTLFLFGYLTGKAGQENKHELPPPHDTVLTFGDILILATKNAKSWKQPVQFKLDEYEAFYTRAFGGFEELDEDDEEDEEDVDEAEEEVEEAEVDADAEVDAEEEADEGDEAEEEEEDEEAEDAEEAEEVDAEVEAEEPIPKKAVRVAAKPSTTAKKAKRGATSSSATTEFSNYKHIAVTDELQPMAISSSSPHRMTMLQALRKLFEKHLNPDEQTALEACIYKASLRAADERHVAKAWSHAPFVEVYRMVAKQIAGNFYPDSYVGNRELFDRYKRGEVSFEDISQMDTYQLFEGVWADSFRAQQVREKRQLEGNKAMATDRFLCSRCHKRECTYYEMQTRSADEPMTIFITCLNCGKHWRQ